MSIRSTPLGCIARMTHRKPHLPEKICLVCGKPFTWRRKWSRSWDEITTCSVRCNAERRRARRSPSS